MSKTTTKKEELAAHTYQAHGEASSASLGRDASAGRGHREQTARQDPARVSVFIEGNLSSMSGHKGAGVQQIVVSFKRKPPEELDRSRQAPLWKATLPQQQDDLEDREFRQPESNGQCFSCRQSGSLNGRPGQVRAKGGMGQPNTGLPNTGLDRNIRLSWTSSSTTPQQPQVVCVKITMGSRSKQEVLEQLEAHTATGEPVALTKEEECKDIIDKEQSQEEWEGDTDQNLSHGEKCEDATEKEPSQEEQSEDTINTQLSQGEDNTGTSSMNHWVNSLGLENKDSHTSPQEEHSWPTSVGREAAEEAAAKLQSTSSDPVSPTDAHMAHSAQVVSPQEEKHQTSLIHEEVKSTSSLDFIEPVTATEAENQVPALHSPTASALAQLDTAQYIKGEVLDEAQLVFQCPSQQSEELLDLELSMSETTAAGTPEGPAYRSLSPTVIDALAQQRRMSAFKRAPRALPRASIAGEQEKQHQTACAPALLDTAQHVRSEAVTVIWGPEEKAEELRDLAQSTHEVTTATATAEEAESPAHAPHNNTADASTLLDTAQYIRSGVLGKAVTVIQGPEVKREELRDLAQSTHEVATATATAERAESPTADAAALLDMSKYIRSEILGKAVLVTQGPKEDKEEQMDLAKGRDNTMRTTATAEGTESLDKAALVALGPVQQTEKQRDQ
ncbi:hypothetical protein WISP_62234 [Willisornis vidua]|uniref:Uncharacterized protein n=1 Tax=Willisornis vidua TaxID=1566151 RepID=A0ABQ9DFY1_9PASS|nr:hypothetical protein WISP_62234 [Willisornis vidua]